jgi:rhombotail lipoprotein
VQYLYPDKTEPIETPTIPSLSLPLKVGIAFVPEGKRRLSESVLSEKERMDLMEQIGSRFKQYPFVKSIELIPSAYLTSEGGFTNLDQLRTMYAVDVMALLSYDQVQHTDQGLLSITYWTLVGAYIFRGEKNDTSTMIDAAVYHIPSRKMLFRAPGTSRIQGSATIVNLSEQLRQDARAGFRQAAETLVVNLQEQLEIFKEKVKESPEEFRISHKPGYTGGGSLGAFSLLLLAWIGGFLLCWRKRRLG